MREGPKAKPPHALLQQLQLRGLLPAGVTYSAVNSACRKGHSRREPCSSSRQCCTRPPARRDHLERIGQCLRKGYTAAESLAAPRGNDAPRPPARRDHRQRLGQCLRQSKRAQPQRALHLLEAMLHQGLLPDGIPYDALISACGKGTQPQRALQLLEAMMHHGLLPDGITYSALVSACGKGAQPQSALHPWGQ